MQRVCLVHSHASVPVKPTPPVLARLAGWNKGASLRSLCAQCTLYASEDNALFLSVCLATQAGQIIKDMGWYALFTRGLGLRIIMVGTLTGLQWGIYDAYKVFTGLPTTGSVEPAKAPAAAPVAAK